MPEKDYPSKSVGEVMTDDEMYLILQNRFDTWRFDQHASAENVKFCYELAVAVIDNFPYLGRGASGDFKGEELPSLLRMTFANIYVEHDFETREPSLGSWYRDDFHVWMKRRENHSATELEAPDEFFEIIRTSKTHNEAVSRLLERPDILEQVKESKDILDNAILLNLSEGYSRNGLQFIIEPGVIDVSVYGDRDETIKLCNFLINNHDKPMVLAETVSGLLTLGAKHCRRPESPQYAHFNLSDNDRAFLDRVRISTERH